MHRVGGSNSATDPLCYNEYVLMITRRLGQKKKQKQNKKTQSKRKMKIKLQCIVNSVKELKESCLLEFAPVHHNYLLLQPLSTVNGATASRSRVPSRHYERLIINLNSKLTFIQK